MPVVLYANTDLVVCHWLLSLPGISSGMVGTTLPKDNASWAANGFIQAATVGGSPNVYYGLRNPVVALNCWAVNPSSNKPPWGQANNLAEIVVAATHVADGATITGFPSGYPSARLLSAWVVTEPRRIYSDEGGYARYGMNLGLSWTELPA